MKNFLYVLTALGSMIGAFFLFSVFTTAGSAPQEASLAAVAVAFAVIPYCLARAAEGIERTSMSNDLHAIAEHYRRIDHESAQQRLAETRHATDSGGANSPFAPMR